MNQIATSIRTLEHVLLALYDPISSNQYAWWLVEKVTGKSKMYLLTHDAASLTPHEQEQLTAWLKELITEHKPIQYILGSVPFNGLDILVRPPTLIPRPETEEWAGAIAHELTQCTPHEPLRILDLCCGTGCIALTLAQALPQATVYATDIAPAALELAQENARHNGITNVTFIESDLFNAIPSNFRFDLIVSNPPYIASQEWGDLELAVTAWEDRQALIADDQGLAILKKIITQAPAYITQNERLRQAHIPTLMVEIGYQQGAAVAQLFQQAGYTAITIRKDLEGKDRVVCGR